KPMTNYFVPSRAAIMGDINAATEPAAVQAPRFDVHLPQACKERLRVMRVHRKLRAAGVFIDEQRLLPSLAAVAGLEDAALPLWPVRLPDCARKNDIRIMRINDDASNVAGLLQSHAAPRPAAVCVFVDAVAHGVKRANQPGLTGSGSHCFMLRGRHGQRADC